MERFVHDRSLLKMAVLNSVLTTYRPKSNYRPKSIHRPKPLSLVRYRLNDTLKQNEKLRQQLNDERHLIHLLRQTRKEFKKVTELSSKLLEKTADKEQKKKTMTTIKHFEKILSDLSCELEETFN